MGRWGLRMVMDGMDGRRFKLGGMGLIDCESHP
jgi:hypothetical protein